MGDFLVWLQGLKDIKELHSEDKKLKHDRESSHYHPVNIEERGEKI
jgi:hypothetical protein